LNAEKKTGREKTTKSSVYLSLEVYASP